MNNLKEYIVEKLKLNKDSKSEDFKYILFHKDDPYKQWVAGVHKSLSDIGYYLKCHRLPGCHDIWECPAYLVKEFIKKWKESPGNKRYNNVIKYDKELANWVEENKLREISADEINKYIH